MIFATYYLESIYGPVLLKRKEETEPKCDDIIEIDGKRYRIIKSAYDYEMWQWLKTYWYTVLVRKL